MRIIISLLIVFLMTGCIPQAAKQLNIQNLKAAQQIIKEPSNAPITAKDIIDNCASLAKDYLGTPEVDLPYTPQNSQKAREDLQKQTDWFGWIKGVVNSIPGSSEEWWVALGLAALGWFSTYMRARRQQKINEVLYNTIDDVQEQNVDSSEIKDVIHKNATAQNMSPTLSKV